jgi:cytochrome c-type biogenesis protein CcmH
VNKLLLSLLLSISFHAAAEEKDAGLEARVAALSNELRCLVCQNQTLADSNAPLAVDLRNTIREQLAKGASEREVLDFMTARYGDFVLYRPPFKAATLLLWIGPFLFLLLGAFVFHRRIRKRPEEPALAAEEREKAARLLDGP